MRKMLQIGGRSDPCLNRRPQSFSKESNCQLSAAVRLADHNRREVGRSSHPKWACSAPQTPRLSINMTAMAVAPIRIRYHDPQSAAIERSAKKMMTPMIGPSSVPMPPITTMKMTKAVQSVTEKAESGVMRRRWKDREGSSDPGHHCCEDIDKVFRPSCVDAHRLSCCLIITNGGQCHSPTRPEEGPHPSTETAARPKARKYIQRSRPSRLAAIDAAILTGREIPEPPPSEVT